MSVRSFLWPPSQSRECCGDGRTESVAHLALADGVGEVGDEEVEGRVVRVHQQSA